MSHLKPSLVALFCAVVLVACPSDPTTPGTDGGPLPTDAGPPPPDGLNDDAGDLSDAPVVADAPTDAGPPPLPPITNPDPHTVAASADGHDRLYAVTFAPDSSFYVAGVAADGTGATDDYRTIVGHFDAAGDLDPSFGTGGWFTTNLAVGTNGEIPHGIALQSDGSIVVAATIEHVATGADARDRDVAVLRLNRAGALDAAFGTGGIAIFDLSDGEAEPAPSTAYLADSSWNVVVDDTDHIIVAVGLKRAGEADTDFGVLRLTPTGERDAGFGTAGLFSLDVGNASASVRSVLLLPDGRILASGYYRNASMVVVPVLYALTSTGSLDAAFATGGVFSDVVLAAQAEIYDLDLQGTNVVTAGYGRDDGPGDNDFITMRFSTTTGARDAAYGTTGGVGILGGYDFGDNARAVLALPDDRVMLVGALRTPDATEADAALVVFNASGVPDAAFGTGGVELVNTAGLLVDHLWAVDIDPRGERVVAVGIGGTATPSDDDGLVYLFPTP